MEEFKTIFLADKDLINSLSNSYNLHHREGGKTTRVMICLYFLLSVSLNSLQPALSISVSHLPRLNEVITPKIILANTFVYFFGMRENEWTY